MEIPLNYSALPEKLHFLKNQALRNDQHPESSGLPEKADSGVTGQACPGSLSDFCACSLAKG
jgi:hypothetical protein